MVAVGVAAAAAAAAAFAHLREDKWKGLGFRV